MAKGGKAKGKKAKAGDGSSNADYIDPATKALFKVQLKDLEEKLERAETKCDVLNIENLRFREDEKVRQQEQKDNFEGYKKSNGDTQEHIQDIKLELIGMNEKISSFKAATKSKFESFISLKNKEISALKGEHSDLDTYLLGLIQFRDTKKAELEERYRNLQANLDKIQNQHNATLYTLEQKNAHDRELLKKESINKVNSVAGEFRRVSNMQMAETTKRTNTENEAVVSQIAKLEEKEAELIFENNQLKNKFETTNFRLGRLEEMEACLSRKNHGSARLMALLSERATEVEDDLERTEQILNDTRSKLNNYDDGCFKPWQYDSENKKMVGEQKTLKEENGSLEELLAVESSENFRLQKVIDVVTVDLSRYILGASFHEVSRLEKLLALTAESGSEETKRRLQLLLGEDKVAALLENF